MSISCSSHGRGPGSCCLSHSTSIAKGEGLGQGFALPKTLPKR